LKKISNLFINGLKCVNCDRVFPLDPKFFVCPKCGLEKFRGVSIFKGATEVFYDYEAIANSISKELFASRPFNALRYRELLGFGSEEPLLTLGEGGTPLIRSKKLADKLKLNKLLLKNEAQNPTCSFKDRESVMVVNGALKLGKKYLSCVSSGNAAASIAAYAARAGLGCFVFMPASTSEGKVSQCSIYGARVLLLNGIYEEIFEIYFEAVKDLKNIFESSAGHNRLRLEGDKTIAYEICEQLGWRAPAWVIDNVGNGTHLYGMWKGFKELKKLGLIDELPRMAAAGPSEGAPVVEAFKTGRALPLESSRESVAEGLVGRWGYDVPLALRALRESRGFAEYVSNDEILEAMKSLARFEGIFVEPSGVACIAALPKMIQAGIIDSAEEVVCIITGSGLKDPKTGRKISESPMHVPLNIDAIRAVLQP
jgi:threonine synthase